MKRAAKIAVKSGEAVTGQDTPFMKYAVIVSILIGIFTVAFIFLMTKSESYSALYIRSYSNYIENGTVSFIYGVDRFGPSGASYVFRVLVGGVEYHAEAFDIKPGRMEWNVSFPLNETDFPVKVQLVLREGADTYYETYFWLKGAR